MLRAKPILALLAGALALGACDAASGGLLDDGSARVSLLLTDAPGDLEAAVVTITDVYLQPGEGEGAERVYLRRGDPITVDLLTLQNEVEELVTAEAVPAGHYEQLRLVITGGYLEVEKAGGGTTIYASSPGYEGLPEGAVVSGELKMPSYSTSGLKVVLADRGEGEDGAVLLDGDQTLLIDFDVSRSFGKPAGKSGKWVMHPVLKATRLQASASATVTLALAEGVALPAVDSTALTLGAFEATLAPAAGGDAKAVRFTDADGDGVFEAAFRYLRPGDFVLGVAGPAGITFATDPAAPIALTLASGASQTTALRLTAAARAAQ